MPSPRTALITGASSGFGQLTTVTLASRGWQVLATMRDLNRREKLEAAAKNTGVLDRIEFHALDVTNAGQLAAVHGRVLGASDQEIEHAAQAASAALQHPLLQRARRSKHCQRELPILLKLEGNRILEGVIDLAFEENGTWHIVDFKTDAEIAPSRKRYENQLRWYCLALARLNQAPVEAHLLSV